MSLTAAHLIAIVAGWSYGRNASSTNTVTLDTISEINHFDAILLYPYVYQLIPTTSCTFDSLCVCSCLVSHVLYLYVKDIVMHILNKEIRVFIEVICRLAFVSCQITVHIIPVEQKATESRQYQYVVGIFKKKHR